MLKSRSSLVGAVSLIIAVLVGTQAKAADQGITGKKLLLKSKGKIVLLSKDASISIADSDPIGGADSSFSIDTGSGPVTYNLPATNWSANGKGTLFKYKNKLAPAGPSAVKIAKVKPGLLKVVVKTAPFSVPSGPATIDVVLSLDGGTNTYCMTFSGTGEGGKFLVKDAAAGSCATATPTDTPTATPTVTPTATAIPPPLCGDTFPACGGNCAAGQSCSSGGSSCSCVPETVAPCGGSEPQCNGACPVGETCNVAITTDGSTAAFCGCLPVGATPCVNGTAPVCGGDCPFGSCTDSPFGGGSICICF